jgi:hypothetical protein
MARKLTVREDTADFHTRINKGLYLWLVERLNAQGMNLKEWVEYHIEEAQGKKSGQ